jgi:hypothetical protein
MKRAVTIGLVFHFQGSRIEGRDLGGHESGHEAMFGLIDQLRGRAL